ncbi:MAG: hypothetical protein RIM72_22360 [Alphaproteobacteria bacterium]
MFDRNIPPVLPIGVNFFDTAYANGRMEYPTVFAGRLFSRFRKDNDDAAVVSDRNRVWDRIIIALKLRGQDGRQQTSDQHEKESNPHWGDV